MNVLEMETELDAIIVAATRLKKRIEESKGEVGAAPIFMSITEYADHAQVSGKTVRKWVRLGLPVKRHGKIIRVKVADADAWNEEDATKRSAELAAHGGKP